MKKLIIGTFTIENDIQETNLVTHLESIGAKVSIKPFNDHLKKDKHYKELKKAKKLAEDNYYNFLNNNR